MLGNFGLSYDQSKGQLAVWAILAAPFLLSTDLRTIDPEMRVLLQNRHVIAVNQDKMGISGRMVSRINSIEFWTRRIEPMAGDEYSYAVAFVSRRTDGAPFAFNVRLDDLFLTNKHGYKVKDIFNVNRTEYKILQSDIFEERVNPTGANMYIFEAMSFGTRQTQSVIAFALVLILAICRLF